MEKLPMCRVCLARNVRMNVVVSRNLRELYEKLTDNPFVTEDSRPMLACFFCCTKLKQCYQFQRKCLEAEEQFAQMMNEDYEGIPLINQDHSEFGNGLIQSSVEIISIVSRCQTESIAIKEDVCERLDDNVEPKEEHQSGELELENQEYSFLDVKDISTLHSECDSEDDKPLIEFKIDVEEHEVPSNKQRASDVQRAPAVKKPKLEDVITEEREKNEQSGTKVFRTDEICTLNTVANFKDPLTDTKRGVSHFSFDASCRNKAEIKREKSNKVSVSDFVNRHRRVHVKEKPFKCEICQRSFTQKGTLTKHILIHTDERPYKCEVCQRSFKTKGNLTQHILIHTGEKPFKCDVCQSCFIDKSCLTRHIRTHTGEKPFKCDVCQRCFGEKGSLRKHIFIHSSKKPLKCDVCQRCFIDKNHLTSHIRTHTGEKPYKCDICHRRFNYNSSLTKHIRYHTGVKPFKCDVCQRGFSEKVNLTSHIRTHTGEKPFECNICHRSFRNKGNLTKHILVHTGEKPFKCDVCQRCFGEKSSLRIHSFIHSGEKPFKCHVCQRGFSEKYHLTRHNRTHTGEKPYKCDICHSSFNNNSNLTKHIVRKHT